MHQNDFRRLILVTALWAVAAMLLGGAVRAFASGEAALADLAYRFAALLAGGTALVTLWSARRLLSKQRSVLFGLSGITALALLSVLGGADFSLLRSALLPYPGVLMAIVSAWLIAAVFVGSGEPHRSRFAMFRSQWQVPLYAALATYLVTVLGSYLKALGAASACTGWPLCPEMFLPGTSSVIMAHIGHRAAAALAGLFLLYTVGYVWRRHLNRPLLLALTGSAVVLFASQVVLGALAGREALGPLGSFAHLVIATTLIGTLVVLAVVGYYSPTLPSIAGASAAAALPTVRPMGEVIRAYVALTKPRILMLLLLTAYAAMWVGAKGAPGLGLTMTTMIGLGMSCGAANAINMWFDRDIDAVMKRTRRRPIPAGLLSPEQVLGFGILTGALSFVLLALAVNLLTAVLSLAGLLYYVLIYTMWLKRSTDQNIVIGGAAGAIPPLVGWAAVTGQVSWAAVVMFLIVFVWTPPHFWALALFRNDDYRAAGVPMLPVVKGERHTKWQILLYSVLLIPTTMGLYWTGAVGQVYLWGAAVTGVLYLAVNIRLFFERLPLHRWAVRSFAYSIIWLTVIFLAMVLDIRA